MSEFTSEYEKLLVTQYYNKPKARAEISAKAALFEKINNVVKSFNPEFDLDNATGDRLDKIGKIVGIRRLVPDALPKVFFGFSNNPNSKGFSDKFNPAREGAPFYNKFEPARTELELSDADYILFIRAKIAKNAAASYMVNDQYITIQDAVMTAFEGQAYVVDGKDMTATLVITPSFPVDRLRLILKLDLIPKGMGVGYNIVQAEPLKTFGFSNNPNSKGFSDKFDSSRQGGVFARKLLDV